MLTENVVHQLISIYLKNLKKRNSAIYNQQKRISIKHSEQFQSKSDATTSIIRFEIFTDPLTMFCDRVINLLGSAYFENLTRLTDTPPTIIFLFENNFLELYPNDENFIFNILNLLPILSR